MNPYLLSALVILALSFYKKEAGAALNAFAASWRAIAAALWVEA